MPKKTIEVSIKPSKIIFIILIVAAVVGVVYFAKSKSNSKNNEPVATDEEKTVVLPLDSGVADPGFEGKSINLSALNAKSGIDTREAIDGTGSLKISFSKNPNVSAKISDYFNNIETGNYYRLSFWAKTNSVERKNINFNLVEKENVQAIGQISLDKNSDVSHYELNFKAHNNAADLVLISDDGIPADVWLDDFAVEKLAIDSDDQLASLKPTIFGDTSWKNIDQSQTKDDKDSGDFLSESNKSIGQIFQPSKIFLSGVVFKIQKKGDGGDGSYQVQLREFDDKLGLISDEVLAAKNVDVSYPQDVLDEMAKKEQAIRDDFDAQAKKVDAQNSSSDPKTADLFAQQQQEKMDAAIKDMKESYNVPEELEISLSAKLDPQKKYWIGIDNSSVKVDNNNYIKIFFNSKAGADSQSGYVSSKPNAWQEYYTLWFKTFYPVHAQSQGQEILSGATISDSGDSNLIYRYNFAGRDYSSVSEFSGRKIYDMYAGNFKSSDIYGNYKLSGPDDYAVYKFNTLQPAKKITIRSATYHQSLAIDFSTDGENWKEVYSENPAEINQTINPLVINPDGASPVFCLRIKPAGNDCTLFGLALEAELAPN